LAPGVTEQALLSKQGKKIGLIGTRSVDRRKRPVRREGQPQVGPRKAGGAQFDKEGVTAPHPTSVKTLRRGET